MVLATADMVTFLRPKVPLANVTEDGGVTEVGVEQLSALCDCDWCVWCDCCWAKGGGRLAVK